MKTNTRGGFAMLVVVVTTLVLLIMWSSAYREIYSAFAVESARRVLEASALWPALAAVLGGDVGPVNERRADRRSWISRASLYLQLYKAADFLSHFLIFGVNECSPPGRILFLPCNLNIRAN